MAHATSHRSTEGPSQTRTWILQLPSHLDHCSSCDACLDKLSCCHNQLSVSLLKTNLRSEKQSPFTYHSPPLLLLKQCTVEGSGATEHYLVSTDDSTHRAPWQHPCSRQKQSKHCSATYRSGQYHNNLYVEDHVYLNVDYSLNRKWSLHQSKVHIFKMLLDCINLELFLCLK